MGLTPRNAARVRGRGQSMAMKRVTWQRQHHHWLKLEEVADRWACSVATVRRRIHDGALVAMRDGHVLRVDLAEVERYERDHCGRRLCG
jgi:excisionase family DNA binding protein